jgi:hypothetical protein
MSPAPPGPSVDGRSVLLRRSAYSDHLNKRLHPGQPRRNLRHQVPRHFPARTFTLGMKVTILVS